MGGISHKKVHCDDEATCYLFQLLTKWHERCMIKFIESMMKCNDHAYGVVTEGAGSTWLSHMARLASLANQVLTWVILQESHEIQVGL
jgi:hypothetical protein